MSRADRATGGYTTKNSKRTETDSSGEDGQKVWRRHNGNASQTIESPSGQDESGHSTGGFQREGHGQTPHRSLEGTHRETQPELGRNENKARTAQGTFLKEEEAFQDQEKFLERERRHAGPFPVGALTNAKTV